MGERFKTKFCWWPVRLVRMAEGEYGSYIEVIGWVWMQKAHLTNNISEGWLCFLDSKPHQERCKKCGQLLPENEA